MILQLKQLRFVPSRGSFRLWCACVVMMTKENVWSYSRLIIFVVNMDSLLFHFAAAAAEMIKFPTPELEKGHSSCWEAVFVHLYSLVQMCVDTPCTSLLQRPEPRKRSEVCVCMWAFRMFSHHFAHMHSSYEDSTHRSTQMSQIIDRRAVQFTVVVPETRASKTSLFLLGLSKQTAKFNFSNPFLSSLSSLLCLPEIESNTLPIQAF